MSRLDSMKNLAVVSAASKTGIVSLYYSIRENAVYTEAGPGRWYVTDLIRYNTEDEIKQAVRRMLSM